MSAVKEGCRKAFQAQPQRLMLAMYTCNILANAEILGEYHFPLFHFVGEEFFLL
jgi:ribosome assembly protein 1